MLKKFFNENKTIKYMFLTLAICFFSIYYSQIALHEDSIFSFIIIKEVDSSFINYFLTNIYWFMFFWLGSILPLDFFFKLLVDIPILVEIRNKQKKSYVIKMFIIMLKYTILYVFIFTSIEIFLEFKSIIPILLTSFILLISLYTVLLIGVLSEIIFKRFFGVFIQTILICISLFYSKFEILPKEINNIQSSLFLVLTDICLIFLLQFLIYILYMRKEIF